MHFIITLIQGLGAKQFFSSSCNRVRTYQNVLRVCQSQEFTGTQNSFSYITSSIYL